MRRASRCGLRRRPWQRAAALLLLGAMGSESRAGIDSRLAYDNSGIWARSNQTALEYGLMATEVAGALWEGGETRSGRTFWQAIDSSVIGGVSSTALKYVFSRERPSQTADPNRWFTGHGQSFPSGEVTLAASVVTPFILEYGREHPGIWALELLPAYDAVARMKLRAHWQTDVLAGFALGTATGWIAHAHAGTPWTLAVMPHAVYVGIHHSF